MIEILCLTVHHTCISLQMHHSQLCIFIFVIFPLNLAWGNLPITLLDGFRLQLWFLIDWFPLFLNHHLNMSFNTHIYPITFDGVVWFEANMWFHDIVSGITMIANGRILQTWSNVILLPLWNLFVANGTFEFAHIDGVFLFGLLFDLHLFNPIFYIISIYMALLQSPFLLFLSLEQPSVCYSNISSITLSEIHLYWISDKVTGNECLFA